MLEIVAGVVCMFALVLVSVPCAMCAPQGGTNHRAMVSAHCDDCCSSAPMAAAEMTCCVVHAPAAVAAAQTIDVAPAGDAMQDYEPVAVPIVLANSVTNRPIPPPLLKNNLRI